MKPFFSSFIVCFLLFSCTGKTAIGYNDAIIKPQLQIVSEMDTVFAGPETSVEAIRKNRNEMVDIAKEALQNIRKLQSFKGNTSFKNSAVAYFSFIENYFSGTEGLDSIIYKFNSPERIQSLTEDQYNETRQEFNNYLTLEEKLLAEQKKFAEEFNMPFHK